MPTTKPRIQVTETEELARALEVAEELWPGESKSVQVCRLASLGAESAVEATTRRALEIRKLMDEFHKTMGDSFAGLTLGEVRKAWERN